MAASVGNAVSAEGGGTNVGKGGNSITTAGAVGRGASMVGTRTVWLAGSCTAARVAQPPNVAVNEAEAISALIPCRLFCAIAAFGFGED
jgi:hypothetical protein